MARRKPRTPREPTAAELLIFNARLGRTRRQEGAAPTRRRAPREPTAAEKRAFAARTRTAARTARTEDRVARTPANIIANRERTASPTSDIAIERFKRSDAYAEALAAANLAKRAQEGLKRIAEMPKGPGPSRTREILTFGLAKRHDPRRIAEDPDFTTKGKSLAELAELTTAVESKKPLHELGKYNFERLEREEASLSPAAEKILDLAMRTTYAQAGAASAALKGKSPIEVAKAAGKGVTGKEKKTFSTVLAEHGVKGAKGTVGGLALDIALDPLTYVTVGRSSVVKQGVIAAAKKQARAAQKAALVAGASRAQARARARGVFETAVEKGTAKAERQAKGRHLTSGAEIRFAGKRLPGVTRATGAATHATKAAARPVTGSAAGQAGGRFVRGLGSEAHAGIRKVGQSREEQQAVKALQRETRAAGESTARHISARANALLGRLTEAERKTVIDAIESGKVRSLRVQRHKKGPRKGEIIEGTGAERIKTRKTVNLRELRRRARDARDPDRLYNVARRLEDDWKYLRRVGQRSGVLGTAIGPQAAKRVVSVTQASPQGIRSPGRIERELKLARQEQAQSRVAQRKLEEGEPVPTREEFTAKQQIVSERQAPEMHKISQHLSLQGKPGINVETKRIIVRDPKTKQPVKWGDEIPDEKVVTFRNENGKVVGALDMLLDEKGKANVVEVVVNPEFRGKGIANRLYAEAERHGFDVEKASGRVGYTPAGAALAYKRLVERAAQSKAKPSERQAARRRTRHAQERVEQLRRQRAGIGHRQTGAQARARGIAPTLEKMAQEAQSYVPRTHAKDLESRSAFRQIAEGDQVPVAEKTGSNRPTVGQALRREHRATRAELAVTDPQALAKVSDDVQAMLARQGSTLGRAAAARNLNTQIVQRFGEKLTKNPSKAQVAEWAEQGKSVYRVRRGILERVDPSDYGLIRVASQRARPLGLKVPLDPKTGRPIRQSATTAGGQYKLIEDALVERIRDVQPDFGSSSKLLRGWDALASGFKRAALSTPGYLMRNLAGDAYNAWGDERFWRLAKNFARGQKALADLGKWEKALHRFERQIPEGKRTVKLKQSQADEIAAAIGAKPGEIGTKVPAQMVAVLAERMGVIRQGRFLELMTEGGRLARPRGVHQWDKTVRWVEDSTRISTFLGGLQRGMSPREAATRASKIHFDYGDLTGFEKGISRRAMPFYTFTSRNIPLQAERLVTRPGKVATLAKTLEAGRQHVGLPEDFRSGQNEYEKRQLGLPVRFGDKVYTISIGSPFVDLNDIAAVATGGLKAPIEAANVAIQRGAELLSPFIKVAPEVKYNFSTFFREQIQPDVEQDTRAPEWAVAMGKGSDPASTAFRKATGLRPDYVPAEGDKVWGWSRKADYLSRQVPGAFGALTKTGPLGVQKGKNARAMEPWQQILSFMGPRVIEYDKNQAAINRAYDEAHEIRLKLNRLRRTAHPENGDRIGAENPTPTFEKLAERLSVIETDLDERMRIQRPGGYVKGRRVEEAVKKLGGGGKFGGSTGFGGGGKFGGSAGF